MKFTIFILSELQLFLINQFLVINFVTTRLTKIKFAETNK